MRTLDQIPKVDLNAPVWDYLRIYEPYNAAEKAEKQMAIDFDKYVAESKVPRPKKEWKYKGGAGRAT